MADITGFINEMKPANGSNPATGSTGNLSANAKVTIPAGVVDYKTTIRVSIYSYETCVLDQNVAVAVNNYPGGAVPQTYLTSDANATVLTSGGYLATAVLVAQKKKADGSLGPEVELDSKSWSFQIGTTGCSPSISICTGIDTPVATCTAPVPAAGSTILPGPATFETFILGKVQGSTTCTKEFRCGAVMSLQGPVSKVGTEATQRTTGVGPVSFYAKVTADLTPGHYTATVTTTVNRTDGTTPACNKLYTSTYSWEFDVSSSSSSSSSLSSSSLSSS
jgi:hypothetical protein